MAPMQKLDGGAPTGSSQVLLNKVKNKIHIGGEMVAFQVFVIKRTPSRFMQ